MGYYTYYSLEAHNVKDQDEYNAIVKALQDRKLMDDCSHDNFVEVYADVFSEGKYYEDTKEAYFTSYDSCKWYDNEYDMMLISKQFPDVVFRLNGDGEEREDLWRKYFKNGMIEDCHAVINFPEPVEIEWNE